MSIIKAMYVRTVKNSEGHKISYAKMIGCNYKTIETRSKNTLKSLVGERVAVIETGCKEPMIVAYADVTGVIKYDSKEAFDSDFYSHLVDETSPYYCDGIKYGYTLANIRKCTPHPFKKVSGNRSWAYVQDGTF